MTKGPKTASKEVVAFRQRYGLTQPALEKLLGFKSEGAAVGRWEREGAPYYATLLFKLVDEYGIELMREICEAGGPDYTPPDQVDAFRSKYKLISAEMDRLFGLSSNGRATRRWTDPLERGAPSYITVMMAYADRYGLDALRKLAPSKA